MSEVNESVKIVENTLLDGTKQKMVVVVRNANDEHNERLTFGDKLADAVAKGGGSWKFIIFASLFLIGWTSFNSLASSQLVYDPYPFVFLNLILSMIAALQAPIIMMSQNRQGLKDRLSAQLDYEVNCKAEASIEALHEKLHSEMRGLEEKLSQVLKLQDRS